MNKELFNQIVDVLLDVKSTSNDDDEQKAYEDMKPHEQIAEIGRREIIKFEKEKKLTESEYEKLSKEFDKFLGLDK